MIPKIAHFIWIGSPVPDWAQLNIKSFADLNPDFEIKLHRAFPRDTPRWYYELACSVSRFCMKADLLRYRVLKKYGGLYFDIDFEFLNPIPDELMQTSWACKDGKGAINNAALGAIENSLVIAKIVSAIQNDYKDNGVPNGRTAYGPSFLSKNNFGFEIFDRTYFYSGMEGKVARHSWGVQGSSHRATNKDFEEVLRIIGPDCDEYITDIPALAEYISNSHECKVICE